MTREVLQSVQSTGRPSCKYPGTRMNAPPAVRSLIAASDEMASFCPALWHYRPDGLQRQKRASPLSYRRPYGSSEMRQLSTSG